MKRPVSFAVLSMLFLTSCTPVQPAPTASLTARAQPTSTQTLTPTPDPFAGIIDALQDKGINVVHLVGNADGGWGLIVEGVEVPDAHFEESGAFLVVQAGDEQIKVPAGEAADRLRVTEDGILVLDDAGGNAIAAFGPRLTAEKLAGRWFTESEVISTDAENPIVVGDTWQDHIDFVHAEKVFIEPLWKDTGCYWPTDPDKIVIDYWDKGAGSPEEGFTPRTPFGQLEDGELDRSPFWLGVNKKVLKANPNEDRFMDLAIIVQANCNPKNPDDVQLMQFAEGVPNENRALAFLNVPDPRGRGVFMHPLAFLSDGYADPEKQPKDHGFRDLFVFWRDFGLLDGNGNLSSEFVDAILKFMRTGEMDDWLEEVPLIGRGVFIVKSE